ncbi:MAG: hypothetical protein HYX21_00165 [Candidatus Yanofskybacteria bacterium]|nr:hypothetical protein [Candidatus Yanofskybacteria bacterium]
MNKSKLLIFEGIASSGKTTIVKELTNKLKENSSVEIIGEGETLMPLVDNISKKTALKFLKEFLDSRVKKIKTSVVIIDRFHFTHAFRTKSSVNDFKSIEGYLLEHYQPFIILLKMDESKIQERIEHARILRGEQWVKGKSGTLEEKIEYYTNQQRYLLELSRESKLKTVVVDTTVMNWTELADDIVSNILL